MLRSALLITLVVFSATAGAQGLGYNYLQASYGTASIDDPVIDVDGDGFGILGSFAFSDNFHVSAEYQTVGMDFGVDLNVLEAAFGYHTSLSENLDFTAQLGYLNAEVEAPGLGSADEDGILAGIGLRAAVSERVELYGGLDYIDFDTDGETRYNAGFLFGLTDSITVGAKASIWEDIDVYQLNFRFDFE